MKTKKKSSFMIVLALLIALIGILGLIVFLRNDQDKKVYGIFFENTEGLNFTLSEGTLRGGTAEEGKFKEVSFGEEIDDNISSWQNLNIKLNDGATRATLYINFRLENYFVSATLNQNEVVDGKVSINRPLGAFKQGSNYGDGNFEVIFEKTGDKPDFSKFKINFKFIDVPSSVCGLKFENYDYESKMVSVGKASDADSEEVLTIPEKIKQSGVVYTVSKVVANGFDDLPNLETIYLPSTIESLGSYLGLNYAPRVFYNCPKLKIINYVGENYTTLNNSLLIDKRTNTLLYATNFVDESNFTSLLSQRYSADYDSQTGLLIESYIENIGTEAFSNRKDLKTIIIPENIKRLGFKSFGYSGVKSVTLPSSIKDVNSAFYGCDNLEEIILTGDNSKYECINNKCLVEKDTKTLVCSSIYTPEGSSSVYAYIPEGATKISSTTFAYWKSIQCVVIPETITEIQGSAFGGCVNLKTVIINSSSVANGANTDNFLLNYATIVLVNTSISVNSNSVIANSFNFAQTQEISGVTYNCYIKA